MHHQKGCLCQHSLYPWPVGWREKWRLQTISQANKILTGEIKCREEGLFAGYQDRPEACAQTELLPSATVSKLTSELIIQATCFQSHIKLAKLMQGDQHGGIVFMAQSLICLMGVGIKNSSVSQVEMQTNTKRSHFSPVKPVQIF